MFLVHMVHIALVALIGVLCLAFVLPGVAVTIFYWIRKEEP
jgi:hypothetical protein